MKKALYFAYSYEVLASLLYGSRFLCYSVPEGEHSRLLNKDVNYQNETTACEFVRHIFKLDHPHKLEMSLVELTEFYKNHSFFVTDSTLYALSEFTRTNTLLPAGGEWANSSDGFLHLVPYALASYTKEGHFLLERKQVLEHVDKITNYTHANHLVMIAHGLFFSLLSELLKARIHENGHGLNKKQVQRVVDEAVRKTFYRYRDYQYHDDLRYFVRLDKSIYDHATTTKPSAQIAKMNSKELRAGNYVIDTLETLLYLLVRGYNLQEGIAFLSDIPGFQPINGLLYTLLHSLAYGLPNMIKTSLPESFFKQETRFSHYLDKYHKRAFQPIRNITAQLSGEQVLSSEMIQEEVSQLRFEFARLGFYFPRPLIKVGHSNHLGQAYYHLYILVHYTASDDPTFIGQLMAINHIINS